MKRAAHFGRAPVVHDLRAAFTVFGFFDPSPPPELVELRRALFAQVRSPHHYGELRDLVDTVPVEVLGRSNAEITKAYSNDWRGNLSH